MGLRGPPPTPTPILKLRGSKRVTRRRERAEAQGPAGRPDCPDWLSEPARAKWHEVVPKLELMRVLTTIDEDVVAQYCHDWTLWREMEQFIREHGVMYPMKDAAGRVKCMAQWPQVGIASKLVQQLTRLERELGLTPAARTRAHTTGSLFHPPSAKDRFFRAI